jgi:hypothetical protein
MEPEGIVDLQGANSINGIHGLNLCAKHYNISTPKKLGRPCTARERANHTASGNP